MKHILLFTWLHINGSIHISEEDCSASVYQLHYYCIYFNINQLPCKWIYFCKLIRCLLMVTAHAEWMNPYALPPGCISGLKDYHKNGIVIFNSREQMSNTPSQRILDEVISTSPTAGSYWMLRALHRLIII